MEKLPAKSEFPKLNPVRNFFEKLKKKKRENEISNGVKAPSFTRALAKGGDTAAASSTNLVKTFWLIVSVIIISSFFGFAGGLISSDYLAPKLKEYN